MDKDKLHKILTEKFINDEISLDKYIKLTEKIENLTEANIIKMVKPALRMAKKRLKLTGNITRLSKGIAKQKIRAGKLPAGPEKNLQLQKIAQFEKRLNYLKKVRMVSYTGGGAAVVGTGVATAKSGD